MNELDEMILRYLKANLRANNVNLDELNAFELLDVACILPTPKVSYEDWSAKLPGAKQAESEDVKLTEGQKEKANAASLDLLKMQSEALGGKSIVSIKDD